MFQLLESIHYYADDIQLYLSMQLSSFTLR